MRLVILSLAVALLSFNLHAQEDSISTFSVKCYPNPTSDLLVIEASEPIKDIMVLNLEGQVVKAAHLPNGCFSLHELPEGWLFFIIESETGKVEKRQVYKVANS